MEGYPLAGGRLANDFEVRRSSDDDGMASCDPAMADPSRNHRGKPRLHLPIWPESEGRSVALGHMG